MPPQETKWTHAPLSGHESRCCSFCNKQAKITQHVNGEWSRLLTASAWSRPRQRNQPARATCGRLVLPRSVRQVSSARPPEPAQSQHSRLPLIRPSRSLLRAPPGTRLRWATRGRVSRPGGSGRTLCRTVAVHSIRHRARRRTATTGTVAAALVSDTATAAAGTAFAITRVASSTGRTSRCAPYCLFVVL